MISKILNFFLPPKKTMLQLAKESLLNQDIVVNSDTANINLKEDNFFLVGSLTPRKNSPYFNYVKVLFDCNNSIVAIKKEDDVLYYFNKQEDVNEIRNTLITIHSRRG